MECSLPDHEGSSKPEVENHDESKLSNPDAEKTPNEEVAVPEEQESPDRMSVDEKGKSYLRIHFLIECLIIRQAI